MTSNDFESRLLKSQKAREAIKDLSFAKELYGALTNVSWRSANHDPRDRKRIPVCYFSFRGAATVVARVRNQVTNELNTYLDFMGSHPEGVVTQRVAELMRELKLHRISKGSWE